MSDLPSPMTPEALRIFSPSLVDFWTLNLPELALVSARLRNGGIEPKEFSAIDVDMAVYWMEYQESDSSIPANVKAVANRIIQEEGAKLKAKLHA